MAATWISSVDLPMPGSPPRSSTEPRTKPPPVTRSNSAMPEGSRGASWVVPASGSSGNLRPLRGARPGICGRAVAEFSSAMVFHSPQASHLPCQRPYTAPQFWQMKLCSRRAIALVSRALVDAVVAAPGAFGQIGDVDRDQVHGDAAGDRTTLARDHHFAGRLSLAGRG